MHGLQKRVGSRIIRIKGVSKASLVCFNIYVTSHSNAKTIFHHCNVFAEEPAFSLNPTCCLPQWLEIIFPMGDIPAPADICNLHRYILSYTDLCAACRGRIVTTAVFLNHVSAAVP